MNIKKIISLVLITLMLTGCNGAVIEKEKINDSKKIIEKKQINRLKVNGLGYTASQGSVREVKWKTSNKFEKYTNSVYSIKVKKYKDSDIKKIINYFQTKDKKTKIDKNGSEITYTATNGDTIFYEQQSGSIEYYSDSVMKGKFEQPIKQKRSNSYYKEEANKFLSETNIMSGINCKFDSVEPCEYIEYIKDGEICREPVRYRVRYVVNDLDGKKIDGILPGISMEFDSSDEICRFSGVARMIDDTKSDVSYPVRDIDEICKSIINGEDVLLDDLYTDKAKLTITSCEEIMYSDAAYLEQFVMMPYYNLKANIEGSNESITILLPKIKASYLEYN